MFKFFMVKSPYEKMLGKKIEEKLSQWESLESENKRLKESIDILNKKIYTMEQDMEFLKKKHELEIQERLNTLKKDMEKSLIQSDLIRTEAVSKLAIYEKWIQGQTQTQ